MHMLVPSDQIGGPSAGGKSLRFWDFRGSLSALSPAKTLAEQAPVAGELFLRIAAVFLAYFIAGKLGQATTNIRSSNLGPVWPAYGIALAAFLAYGYRVWPGIVASAFVVAFSSAVPPLAAAGQAIGATLAALTGASLLRRIPDFDPSLSATEPRSGAGRSRGVWELDHQRVDRRVLSLRH